MNHAKEELKSHLQARQTGIGSPVITIAIRAISSSDCNSWMKGARDSIDFH